MQRHISVFMCRAAHASLYTPVCDNSSGVYDRNHPMFIGNPGARRPGEWKGEVERNETKNRRYFLSKRYLASSELTISAKLA
jgi:hypothetical protein